VNKALGMRNFRGVFFVGLPLYWHGDREHAILNARWIVDVVYSMASNGYLTDRVMMSPKQKLTAGGVVAEDQN